MIQVRGLNRSVLGLIFVFSLWGGLRVFIHSQKQIDHQRYLKILQEEKATQEHRKQILHRQHRLELFQKVKEAKLQSFHDRAQLKKVLDELVATQPLDSLNYKLFRTEKKSKDSFGFHATYITLSFSHKQDLDIFKLMENLDLPGLVIPEQLSLIRDPQKGGKTFIKGSYHFYLITADHNE